MNSDIVIRAENISKRYRLSHLAGQGTLRDALHHAARLAWRRVRWNTRLQREEFWALREVGFEIKRGEVVGVIGRNGAGKSTLLKVLSRITEPTTGRITLRGRVASLLEVGTGFHPELTGRDNIFLNGAILGMSRAEIRRKFDEIVAFAEVERFLDTPVKHYSSGMYVRLAFSVAAHLEPEILIVDEVLAVGDQQFQNKCLGKIRSVAREGGRTVLFVSHNLSVIQSICQRCLLFKQGRIIADGPAGESVAAYLEASGGTTWRRAAPPTSACAFTEATVVVESADAAPGGPWVALRLEIAAEVDRRATLEVLLHDASGQNLALGQIGSVQPLQLAAGRNSLACRFPATLLALGRYSLSLRLIIPGVECLDEVLHALVFEFQAPPPPDMAYRIVQAWGSGSFHLDLRRD